ncbi:HCNGP-like protein-domain-containing protein [Halenospora varia]|nr:HCNGP-like protein-domain-containing protein [Halenospora varia]
MAGLVNYGSSDEDEETVVDGREGNQENTAPPAIHKVNGTQEQVKSNGKAHPNAPSNTPKKPAPKPDAPLVGPALGPSIPINAPEMSMGLLEESQDDGSTTPQSPYSANRALLRDLTLPSLPNYDIPASPPGSPLEGSNAKFKHFLQLKKQGIHFNEKLAKSSALKNPSLMQKLMDFSGIDEAGQYSTTLSRDLWNPDCFPEYAYKEQLAKSQQKILKRKEDEKARGLRESVDFVPASTTANPSRSETPVSGAKPSQKSAAERIMAGLDRGRSNSPQTQGVKRKTRFDS